MKLFSFFKSKPKTCVECEYYSEFRMPTKLFPDKTVEPSSLMCISCEKMDAELKDTEICSVFRERSRTHMSHHAMRIHLGNQRIGFTPDQVKKND